MEPATELGTWDYTSLSLVVLGSSLIGLYHIRANAKSKETKEFLVNSRQLGCGPLIMSSLATFFSAIGMMGSPVETYINGINFCFMFAANILIIPFAVFLYLPVFYKLNGNTVFEYLELRFNRTIRIMSSVLLSLQMILYASLAMYAPALAINQVTGLHLWISIALIAVVCTVYTAFGGFKAVVWADVCQFLVMIVVLLIILVKGTIDVGGVNVAWRRLTEGKRADIIIWKSSPYSLYSVWTLIIGHTVYRLFASVLNQSQMQRYLSIGSMRKAQVSCVVINFSISLAEACFVFLGMLVYAKYYNCDPLLSGQISKRDQMVPLFAVQTLAGFQGLAGVFIAAILCATISTLSSLLNSLATITLSDYIQPFRPQMSENTTLKLSKCLVVVFGILSVCLVASISRFGGLVKALFSVVGITSGPIVLMFTVGMLLPWVHSKGATVGFFVSMLLPWWACIGNLITSPSVPHAPYSIDGCPSNLTTSLFINSTSVLSQPNDALEEFYSLSSLWYTSWSLAVGLIASLIASKLIGFQNTKEVNPDLLFPFLRRYFPTRHAIKTQMVADEEEMKSLASHAPHL